MKLIHKIALTHGVLFISAMACALLAFINTRTSDFYLHRTDLAHRSYEAHLQLSNHSFQLFRQYSNALIKGDSSPIEREQEFLTLIKNDIAAIKSYINQEIALVGDEEVEEVYALMEIEKKIERAKQYYHELIADQQSSTQSLPRQDLLAILDKHINIDFSNAIQNALDEEQKEAIEANAKAKAMLARSEKISIGFALLAIIAACASLYIMLNSISRPLQKIINGARQYSNGEWKHRIHLYDKGELSDIAQAFNKAAEVAETREINLNDMNRQLEGEVNQQTAELRVAMLKLEEQAKIRQQLLADVSHELRTPLTVIQGEIDVALRGKDKTIEEYKEALKIAREASQHTNMLVNDVLFVARQEAGHNRIALEEADLLRIASGAINALQQKHCSDGKTLKLKAKINDAFIEIDKKRIYQVLLILLENAFQYGSKNVEVIIEAINNGFACFVKDDGPGISTEELPNLFERFFRGSNATQQYAAGSGLGLPVAKAIISAHDGNISVKSEPGQGSEFKISLFKQKKTQYEYFID